MTCPYCGTRLTPYTYAKENTHRPNLKTVVCGCGFNTIIETREDKLIRKGR